MEWREERGGDERAQDADGELHANKEMRTAPMPAEPTEPRERPRLTRGHKQVGAKRAATKRAATKRAAAK